MLSTWLNIDPRPSWQTLCAALHSRTVGAEKLASDLEAKYKWRDFKELNIAVSLNINIKPSAYPSKCDFSYAIVEATKKMGTCSRWMHVSWSHQQIRGGTTGSRDPRQTLLCYRAAKAGYCFDILRNESASTDKWTQMPLVGPSLSVFGVCLLLYLSLNFALLEHPQDQRLCRH